MNGKTRFFFVIFVLIGAYCFCEDERYLYIEKINVHKLKTNGKHWDSFKGKPDILCYIFILNDGIWKKVFSTKMKSNVLKIEDTFDTQIKIQLGSKIKIEIIDVDLGNDDLIGRANLSFEKRDFLGVSQQLSFHRVAKFKYILSIYSSLIEKKIAESVKKRVKEIEAKMKFKISKQKDEISKQKNIIIKKDKLISKHHKEILLLKEKIKAMELEEDSWDDFDKETKGTFDDSKNKEK